AKCAIVVGNRCSAENRDARRRRSAAAKTLEDRRFRRNFPTPSHQPQRPARPPARRGRRPQARLQGAAHDRDAPTNEAAPRSRDCDSRGFRSPRCAPEEVVEAAAPSLIEGGMETILVIEDDALVRKSVTAQIQSLGYQTISVALTWRL